jgi:hypothetical protein
MRRSSSGHPERSVGCVGSPIRSESRLSPDLQDREHGGWNRLCSVCVLFPHSCHPGPIRTFSDILSRTFWYGACRIYRQSEAGMIVFAVHSGIGDYSLADSVQQPTRMACRRQEGVATSEVGCPWLFRHLRRLGLKLAQWFGLRRRGVDQRLGEHGKSSTPQDVQILPLASFMATLDAPPRGCRIDTKVQRRITVQGAGQCRFPFTVVGLSCPCDKVRSHFAPRITMLCESESQPCSSKRIVMVRRLGCRKKKRAG